MSYHPGVVIGPQIQISCLISDFDNLHQIASQTGLRYQFCEDDGRIYLFDTEVELSDYEITYQLPFDFAAQIIKFREEQAETIDKLVQMISSQPMEDRGFDDDGVLINPVDSIDVVWATTFYDKY